MPLVAMTRVVFLKAGDILGGAMCLVFVQVLQAGVSGALLLLFNNNCPPPLPFFSEVMFTAILLFLQHHCTHIPAAAVMREAKV